MAADYLKRRLYDNNGEAVRGILADYAKDEDFMRESGLPQAGSYRQCQFQRRCPGVHSYCLHDFPHPIQRCDERSNGAMQAFEFYFAIAAWPARVGMTTASISSTQDNHRLALGHILAATSGQGE